MINFYLLNLYLLTKWSRVFLEKLIVSHLVKKFPTFYGNRMFITAFTSARLIKFKAAYLDLADRQ